MTSPNLKEVLARVILDWKAKRNKNSYECGVQLETELAHFPLDEIDAMACEIDKTWRLLRDLALAFSNECVLPYDSPKSVTLRAVNAYLKSLTL